MARKARVKSSTGIYHVLVRAVSDISLFTDDEDTTIYLDALRSLQDKGRCTIYAYALFPTHVHLLIQEGTPEASKEFSDNSRLINGNLRLEDQSRIAYPESLINVEPIGIVMQRLASTYSYYFNVKYDHYGPIYLDRFKSEPIEDLSTFLACRDFISTQSTDTKGILTTSIPFQAEGQSLIINHLSFIDFSPRRARITDSRLLDYLQRNFSYTNIDEFQQRPADDIRTTILAAKSVGGSIRQITRLTGVPYQTVFAFR